MNRAQKRAMQTVSPEMFDFEHPFIRWFAAYHSKSAAKCVGYKRSSDASATGCDLLMGELASRRFSIGVKEKLPCLGIDENDREAVTSFQWTQAAFLRQIQGSDWVVLSSRDARIENSRSEEPVPLRLWLPCRTGLLDEFMAIPLENRPNEIGLIQSKAVGGYPEPSDEEPFQKLPLVFKGAWENKENTK